MFSEDDLLPISALQHMLFCPRQCALIHIERLWAENSLTLEGRHLHQKADAGRGESCGGGGKGRRERRGEDLGVPATGLVRVTRALPLRSLELGLSGKADVVEFYSAIAEREGLGGLVETGEPSIALPLSAPVSVSAAVSGKGSGSAISGSAVPCSVPYPVEYKRGKPKKDGSDAVQLCAQALCLEEMLGAAVPAGALFYARLRRRTEVVFDGGLRKLTEETIQRMREMIDGRRTLAAVRDKRCDRCSLRFLCLPDATSGSRSAVAYLKRSIGQVAGAGAASD